VKPSFHREDVLPSGQPPKEIQEFLLKHGGSNPFGEPNFRLTIAEETRWYQGGEWHEWPRKASLQRRGSIFMDVDGQIVPAPPSRPLRIVAEMRWIKRFPALHGWIFQEWFPAHHYGAPEDWARYTVPGHPGLSRLGPYPTYGDYELALPFGFGQPADEEVARFDHRFKARPGLPPLNVLRMAINYAEYCRNFWMQMSASARIRCRENQMLEQQALQERWEHDRNRAMIGDAMSPLFSSSLEAGRWRESLVKQGKLKIGHVGN
jgi:hypothetical protein